MNINTNNYQEMLLLYIDGELDVDAQYKFQLIFEHQHQVRHLYIVATFLDNYLC